MASLLGIYMILMAVRSLQVTGLLEIQHNGLAAEERAAGRREMGAVLADLCCCWASNRGVIGLIAIFPVITLIVIIIIAIVKVLLVVIPPSCLPACHFSPDQTVEQPDYGVMPLSFIAVYILVVMRSCKRQIASEQ